MRKGPGLNNYNPCDRKKPTTKTAKIRDLAYFPSCYDCRYFKLFLILGKTDDVKLRCMIVPDDHRPAEIKTLPITWAKAQEMLDQEPEEKYRETNSESEVSVFSAPF